MPVTYFQTVNYMPLKFQQIAIDYFITDILTIFWKEQSHKRLMITEKDSQAGQVYLKIPSVRLSTRTKDSSSE